MEDNKVLTFPNQDNNDVEELIAEAVEQDATETIDVEQKEAIEDQDNPLTIESMKNIRSMMKTSEQMVSTLRSIWESDMKEYDLKDDHMKELYQWNEQNKKPMPEGLTEESKREWDHYNGLDNITEEEVIRIFGESHKIIGIDHDITKDRIKSVFQDFSTWLIALREYQQIHDAYLMLIDLEEEKNMIELKELADKEEDPVKKEKMENSLKLYFDNKQLNFLTDELDDRTFKKLIEAFSDERKVEYWIKRSREKLKQLKISSKFILEISQFEKRFLDEKYHKCSNILLLYFMHKIIYNDMYDKSSIGRTQCISMVLVLDSLIRNRLPEEKREIILNNIKILLDKFIDHLPEKKED